MRPVRLRFAASLCVITLALPAGAQKETAPATPKRPRLQAAGDTNSASAYYYLGMTLLRSRPEEALAAFYWASRLDPSWAEPFYARRVAFHMSDLPRLAKYVEGDRTVVESREVKQADSLLLKAKLRNPYVYRQLDKKLIEELSLEETGTAADWMTGDPEFAGWIAYANGRFDRAIKEYAQALKKRPDAHALHEARAQAFYMVTQFDSAADEVGKAIEALRKKDEKEVTHLYESKAMYEYMAGLAHLRAGKPDAAREALGRALSEDLSFYLAHVRLGALARAQGDSGSATAEYALAVELSPDDAALRYDYAMLLGNRGQYEEALAHLRKATEIEPFYAPPWLALAAIYDGSGFPEQAVANYTAYLARGPNEPAKMMQIRKRLSELAASPPMPRP